MTYLLVRIVNVPEKYAAINGRVGEWEGLHIIQTIAHGRPVSLVYLDGAHKLIPNENLEEVAK